MGSGAKPKTSPERLDAAAKALEAVRLRRNGMTYQEVADEIGYSSKSSAFEAVKRGLAEVRDLTAEEAEELRTLEAMRLDGALQVAWAIMEDEDAGNETRLKAVDRVVKTSESRRKLFGLDGPIKINLSGDEDVKVALLQMFGLDGAKDDDKDGE